MTDDTTAHELARKYDDAFYTELDREVRASAEWPSSMTADAALDAARAQASAGCRTP